MTASVPAYTDKTWTGDGITKMFPFQTRVDEAADLKVWLVEGGVAALKAIGTHYSLSGLGNPGGVVVTFVSAPTAAQVVRIRRETQPKQTVDYDDLGKVPGETTENQLDRLAMHGQDVETRLATYDGLIADLANYPSIGQSLEAAQQSALDAAASAASVAGLINRPENFGAIGDGVADDTNAVELAILFAGSGGDVYLTEGRTYLVSVFDNSQGAQFVGPGKVVTAVTGGQRQRNTYADAPGRQYVYHREYLYYPMVLFNAGMASSSYTVIARFFGDSTIAGGFTEWVKPHEAIANAMQAKGLHNFIAYNHGVGGTDWTAFDPTFGLDTNGGIDFIKYWINRDADAWTLADQIAVADEKLAARRAEPNGGIDKRAIVLITGNSTSETTSTRDEAWHEKVLAALIQLGRKHKCVVWDAYSLMQDARTGTGRWMDNPSGIAGEGIHPTRFMNEMLYGYLLSETLPDEMVARLRPNTFQNHSSVTAAPPATTAPSFWDVGQRWYAVTTALGFPFFGFLKHEKNADTATNQALVGFHNGVTRIATRTANVGGNTWNPWAGVPAVVGFMNGWGSKGGGEVELQVMLSQEGLVTLCGVIAGGTSAAFTELATLPPGFRPSGEFRFIAYGDTGAVRMSLNSSGVLTSIDAAHATRTSISVTFPALGIW